MVPETENQKKPVVFPDGLTGPSSGLQSGSVGFSALELVLQGTCESMD